MSEPLLQRARVFLQAHGLLRPAARLLVAVSGGPDSLCLLHLLCRLRLEGGPELAVAHLDHGFRGDESAAEAAFVAALAAAWGLPARVERRDVPALARAWGFGPPAAARRARYAFLAAAARELAAHAVTVAHHADDQAETVLLHALRGAGPAGLRGMRPVVPWAEWAGQEDRGTGGQGAAGQADGWPARSVVWEDALRPGGEAVPPSPPPPLIRPLLATTRAEILAYCAAHGLEPRDDPSNRDTRYGRPYVRHELLPALERARPGAAAALARAAEICADDYDFIQGQLDARWPALADERPGAVRLRGEVWAGLHPALQRYALRRAAAALGQGELSLARVDAARALHPGHWAELGPGLLIEADQGGLSLHRTGAAPPLDGPQLSAAELPLLVPGEVALGGGWRCMAQHWPPGRADRWWAAIDAGALDGPLLLRRRRAGERMRPAGGRGSRRLQDIMVDAKIPGPLRAAWPLLATPGALVWPAGLRVAAPFAATDASRATIWVGFLRSEL